MEIFRIQLNNDDFKITFKIYAKIENVQVFEKHNLPKKNTTHFVHQYTSS